jgi:hypothetical protein
MVALAGYELSSRCFRAFLSFQDFTSDKYLRLPLLCTTSKYACLHSHDCG